ncbi:29327_t:CDS:2 [Gigaspora margarita]|uniref:29327_t:CDS:1 n=1 Tax=Gigaspora margarita TaxID=4874 RepID=A0ABN7V2U8_GIGMA|nr:29327_t:CDS:2 [Gigaspora margarita]
MSTASLKITHLNSVRKLTVPLSIQWNKLEEQIRTIFSIPSGMQFLLRYRDEDGDLITLNSDLEFEQVLRSGARVKFLLTLPQDEIEQPNIDWEISSESSADTISEEPVLVQQENEKDDDAIEEFYMESGDGRLTFQNEQIITIDKKDEEMSETSSNDDVESETTHDFLDVASLLHPSLEQREPGQHQELNEPNDFHECLKQKSNQQEQQEQHPNSSLKEFSTKIEQVIQKCHKVIVENPEMLATANSVLENTPMYIEFALNMLKSVKNQCATANSPNDASISQHDQDRNPSDMPGSFPNGPTPIFQILPGNLYSAYRTPQKFRPPPPPPLFGLPPTPHNPQRTLPKPATSLPPFPGSFPMANNESQDSNSSYDRYSGELEYLRDMGFTDREQNLSLLRQHNGDIEYVIENIISQRDSVGSSSSASLFCRRDRSILNQPERRRTMKPYWQWNNDKDKDTCLRRDENNERVTSASFRLPSINVVNDRGRFPRQRSRHQRVPEVFEQVRTEEDVPQRSGMYD